MMAAAFEETLHYVDDPAGPAIVRFYHGQHVYRVTDPAMKFKSKIMGGGTSLTGLMDKGKSLQLWPMWEMNKHLKMFFETKTIAEIIDDPDVTLDAILRAGREAHEKKSDRGKSVGTDAHAWVELHSKALMKSQQEGTPFKEPEIPSVEDIAIVLRESYKRIFNTVKPKILDDFKRIPKLLLQEIEMQEAIWTEATMVRNSILAAKEWMDQHEIIVHGTEGTVYSRNMLVCGKYDDDWSVTCTEKCGWCYANGDEDNLVEGKDYTGRYVVDFKSTNSSDFAPKGIYPEYLAQTGVYHEALVEEFPDRVYDGHLILNGAKEQKKDKQGNEFPLFNTHFSFHTERNRRQAVILAELRELKREADREMASSR